MSNIQYTKNGRPWQDQLRVGDSAWIDRTTPGGAPDLQNIDGSLTRIKAISKQLITTEDGEMFARTSLKAVDFAPEGQALELRPDPNDDSIRAVAPTLEALVADGMTREKAREFLELWNDLENE